MSNQTLETEIVEPNAIALRPAPLPPALFGTTEPCEIVAKATTVADALKSVIKKQGLISNIQGKEYPRCEAWTLLGTMLGVFPVCVWTKQVDQGWEARVEARTRDGSILGAAEAQCLRSERNWSNRDDFALRSMAQTRATAKALRMPLGFVMTLAGFEPTPSEEMESIAPSKPQPPRFTEKTTQHSTPPIKTPPSPVSARSEATPEQRTKMVKIIESEGQDAIQRALRYFIEAGAILPSECLSDVPLNWVPTTAGQMRTLGVLIADMSATDKAVRPSWISCPAKNTIKPTLNEPSEDSFNPVDEEEPVQENFPIDDVQNELWYHVVVPIPHKGQKRDDYMKNPDTIGSLFDARHDDEEARKRLFGFINHYEPKGWTGRDGKERPASESDKQFRQALDNCADYMEKHKD